MTHHERRPPLSVCAELENLIIDTRLHTSGTAQRSTSQMAWTCQAIHLQMVMAMGLLGWRRHQPSPVKPTGPQIDRDAVVSDVRPHEFNDHAGTPSCDDLDWHGILLNAPRRIVVRPRPPDPLFGDVAPRAVIWGTCLFPDRPGEAHEDYRTGITLVVVDLAKGKVYRGRVTRRPSFGSVHVPSTPPPPQVTPPSSAAGFNSSSGGPFNPDLIGICGIPLVDADYEIFALSGDWRSNVIDVAVRFELNGSSQPSSPPDEE